MDLHFTGAVPTAEERAAVDRALGASSGGSGAAARAAASSAAAGAACNQRARRLDQRRRAELRVRPSRRSSGRRVRRRDLLRDVLDDAASAVGAARLRRRGVRERRSRGRVRRARIRMRTGGTWTSDGRATWLRSPCLGLCDRAPAALLCVAGEEPIERQIAPTLSRRRRALSFERTRRRFRSRAAHRRIAAAPAATRRRADPESLDDVSRARRISGVDARARSWAASASSRRSSRRNCSAAAARRSLTGRKMQSVAAAAAQPHYVVCNADESEPGTFKDRMLMEHDPFAVIEAMTIAAFAAGCERGFIYVRGEYPLAARRLAHAIAAARHDGLLGGDVMGAASRSTSKSGAAPARTSAAKRRRSSTRSKANAASRAASRRFPSSPDSSASRR